MLHHTNIISEHDVVVVGAGPAGLSAARTAARLGFDTLVIERGQGAGELSHACHSIITPPAGLATAETAADGLHFPEIDLWIPESLVVARQAAFRCLTPGGSEFAVQASPEAPAPVMIDRSGLLRLLAWEARTAGARFMWGTDVASLIHEGSRVVGVRTPVGDVAAELVILASGSPGQFCELEGGPEADQNVRKDLLILSQDLTAPQVGLGQLGCIVTLGRLYTSAQSGFGSLVMTDPGQATMIFAMQVQDPDCALIDRSWQYLAEYAGDPRIARLLSGASVVRRSSFLLPQRERVDRVVRDGLILTGDAATPAGRLGILPAIYLGRQAALVAAGALDAGDTTSAALAPYDDFVRTSVLPGLQAEAAALDALLTMDDAEIDRLAGLLGWLQLPLPVFLGSPAAPAETAGWLAGQLSLPERDRNLLTRLLTAPGGPSAVPVIPAAYEDSTMSLA